MEKFSALSLSSVEFIMLMNVKLPTLDGILTFISRINLVLSLVEHGKFFYNLGLDYLRKHSRYGTYHLCVNLLF